MKNRTLTLILCLTAYAFAGSSLFAQSQGPANIYTSGTGKGQFANPLIVPANSGTGANQFANGATTQNALDGKINATSGTSSGLTLTSPVFSGTATGTLTLNPDAEQTSIFGRLKIGPRFGQVDQPSLAHFDFNTAATNFGLVFAQNGDIYINTPTSATGVHIYENGSIVIAQFEGSQARFIVGSESAPGITFRGDVNTGIYWSGADCIDFATGGVRRGGFNSAGIFDVAGNAAIAGSISIGGGTTLTRVLSASATLNFGSISAGGTEELTITVTGAAVGDVVSISRPAAIDAGLMVEGRVSASNTVTIRAFNSTGSPIDPDAATYRAAVMQF